MRGRPAQSPQRPAVRPLLLLLLCRPSAAAGDGAAPATLTVALAQMWSVPSIDRNVAAIEGWIARAAAAGAQVVAFPECAVTSYNASYMQSVSRRALEDAEAQIQAACKTHRVAAIVGSPGYYSASDRGYDQHTADKMFNMALVIDPAGRTMYRYAKMGLAGWDGHGDSAWAAPGRELSVFELAGVNMSVMICHDVRFPEMTRLPAMAGAQLVVMISDEAPTPWKQQNYRVQVQARAEENSVWVAHVNTPYGPGCTDDTSTCSHGQSMFASPRLNVSGLPEGSVTREELVVHTLDLARASRWYAAESLRGDYGWSGWWDGAVARVGRAR